MANILEDIEAFMEANSLSATAFGDLYSKDRHLVRQLRNGRRLWPETEAKIREFMASYTPADQANAA